MWVNKKKKKFYTTLLPFMSQASASSSASNYSVCWRGDSDCPTCSKDSPHCFTSVVLLDNVFHYSLAKNCEKAQKEYLEAQGIDKKNIKSIQSPFIFHVTLNCTLFFFFFFFPADKTKRKSNKQKKTQIFLL